MLYKLNVSSKVWWKMACTLNNDTSSIRSRMTVGHVKQLIRVKTHEIMNGKDPKLFEGREHLRICRDAEDILFST
jgi:hypothetical protein